jgi:hypothetical protein
VINNEINEVIENSNPIINPISSPIGNINPTVAAPKAASRQENDLDDDMDDEGGADSDALAEQKEDLAALEKLAAAGLLEEFEDDMNLDEIENILELEETKYPRFTLAKNKARFLRMVSFYRQKEEWIDVAPISGVTKLFKQQTKELEGIRSAKLDYEMELETGTLTPSQRSYRRDELKMCRVQEKMAVHLIAKLQLKIKSGRR